MNFKGQLPGSKTLAQTATMACRGGHGPEIGGGVFGIYSAAEGRAGMESQGEHRVHSIRRGIRFQSQTAAAQAHAVKRWTAGTATRNGMGQPTPGKRGGTTAKRWSDGAPASPIYRLLKAIENRQSESENQCVARVAKW
jgi:hypothetical protein